ncbi:hypothetical protein GBAR_LOCUS16476, partial [Geodia barretti]
MSDMELSERYSSVRLVNPFRGEMSAIESSASNSSVRLVAASSPVKSLILANSALSLVKFAISAMVMVAPGALP